MFRRFMTAVLAGLLLACGGLAQAPSAAAQKAAQKKDNKVEPTAEQVAETVVLVYGQRELLAQVRRSGVERGRLTRTTEDGRNEEISYSLSFKRGESFAKDKVRLDQKRPTLEYSLIYNEGRVWGMLRGTTFTPRQEDIVDFLDESRHGIETLLRYKENGSTVAYGGKDKQKNIEMWILDLTDKEQRKTRYYVSAATGRVLWLEYEATPPGAPAPAKFKRTFHDYRIVQGTRVPYRSLLYQNDRQVEETQILSVVFGVKMNDDFFKGPESASAQP